MKETSLIIAQQPWVNALHFYQVKLRPGGDTPRFLHQLTLTRLALFAADALRQLQRQDKAPKPLLIAAPDVEKNKTLVVAVLGSARYWRGPGGLQNSFGSAFIAAASDPKVNAHIAHENFESSVCEVQSTDLEAFLSGVALKYDGARR